MIDIKKPWLTGEMFAGVECKRVSVAPSGRPIARSFSPISRMQEENAVMHTMEGHWGPSMEVFTVTGTPTFSVGWNTITSDNKKASGPLRLAQHMPIGEMALTLKNASGGTETNREALVQIEVVAFSKFEPWLPDEPVAKVLAALMKRLWEVAGIPLQRAGNGTRSVPLWDGKAGWFGHLEVPENDHTDPRALKWDALFEMASPLVPAWQVRSGGKTLHTEKPVSSAELDGYQRTIKWMNNHPGLIREAERENGHVTIRKVQVPA